MLPARHNRGRSATQGEDSASRLDSLGKRIQRAREAEQGATRTGRHHAAAHSAAAVAWRMFADLLAGLLVGFGLGWAVDSVFGTAPLFLILIGLLGVAGGIRLAMRVAAEASTGKSEDGSG